MVERYEDGRASGGGDRDSHLSGRPRAVRLHSGVVAGVERRAEGGGAGTRVEPRGLGVEPPRGHRLVLHLLDQAGAARATLSVTPEGDPTLALTDRDEKSLAAMAITNEGPALGLYDKDRKPLIAAP